MNSTALLANWRPLSSGVEDAQYTYPLAGQVIDQDLIPMCYQLASAGNAARSAQSRIINQEAGFLCE